jgi:formate transporter
MQSEMQIDAFPPARIASRMEEVGVTKAELGVQTMFALAMLAGAFIGTGAIFATVVSTGLASAGVGFGIIKLLSGLVFCLGLIAVVVAGAELFTGNNLIIMAFASGKIGLSGLLRNWMVVYLGNFAGSVLTAAVMFMTKQYAVADGSIGANALDIANAKCSLDFTQALALGVMCNALVCLAVWLCSSARSTTDKILAIIFPITAFVAAGFEHSVANMYFVPMGLFIKEFAGPEFWNAIGSTAGNFANLTWSGFFIRNLLPVSIGNIIGGAGFVGLAYWFIYLRPEKKVVVEAGVAPRILVVDDDPDFLRIITKVLSTEGYETQTASSGSQALEAMRGQRPDLVLLDVMMADPLEGVAVSREMASDADLKGIPIIMVSSIDSSEHASLLPASVHLPIDAWMVKPVTPDYLLKTVRRFVGWDGRRGDSLSSVDAGYRDGAGEAGQRLIP